MSGKEPMAISRDIYLAPVSAMMGASRKVASLERIASDRTIIGPDASLIIERDWAAMVTAAGSEAKLLSELGVTVDERV